MIEVTAQKTRLTVDVTEQITSGSVNVYTVHFHFGSPWDGLEKVAVFNVPGKTINVPVREDDTCVIPWEVTTSYGLILRMGVYGIKTGEVVLPTIWASLGTIVQGVILGDAESGEHTPDIYDLILSKFDEITSLIQAINDRIEEVADDIPTADEITSVLIYYLRDHPSSLYPPIQQYLTDNQIEIEENIKALIKVYLEGNKSAIEKAIKDLVSKYLTTESTIVSDLVNQYFESNPDTIEKAVNDYLTENPPNVSEQKVEQLVKDYLNENPPDANTEQVEQIIQNYLSNNQVGVTEERVQEMINETVGSAIKSGY